MKEHDESGPVPKEHATNAPTDVEPGPRLLFRDGVFVRETTQSTLSTENTKKNLANLRLELGNYNGYPLFVISFELDALINLGEIISITGDQITFNDPISKISIGLDPEGNFSFGGALSLATKGGKPFQVGASASQNGVLEASVSMGYPVLGGVQTSLSTEAKIVLQGHIGGSGLSGSADVDAGTAQSQLYRDFERSIENWLLRGTGW